MKRDEKNIERRRKMKDKKRRRGEKETENRG